MLRYLFFFLLLLHGLIHLLGFAKAYQLGDVSQLTKDISRPMGWLWLGVALLFVVTAVFYLAGNQYWWAPAAAALVLSQGLIFGAWQDARFGTIANLIILLVGITAFAGWRFEREYRRDVAAGLARTSQQETTLLTEADLQLLPASVQRYLRYAGVVGKPKVKNVRFRFRGEMRSREQDWFSFTTEQYNFFDEPTRLFFMKARVKGLPTAGYHRYLDGRSGMQVKALSLIPVVDVSGEAMFLAETVTVFNDMCLFAPATLIDERIRWEPIDENRARATFTNRSVSISAELYFNEEGQLVDFISDDRYDISDMQQYRFSTPVESYQNIDGYNLMKVGEAVWHYTEGAFVYGKFQLEEIAYNVSE